MKKLTTKKSKNLQRTIIALMTLCLIVTSTGLISPKTALADDETVGIGEVYDLNADDFGADYIDMVYINTADDFLAFALNCTLDSWSRDKLFVLGSDISLEDTGFLTVPIFGGTFDGDGHTISGLEITDSLTPAGLFGILEETAVIKNLSVSGYIVPAGDSTAAGGIAGENSGNITDCSFSGTICGEDNTGGIAGINSVTGRIENCTVSGAIFGENKTGGIAGYNLGVIDGCENNSYINIASVDPSLSLDDIQIKLTLDIAALGTADTSTASNDTGGIAGYSSGAIVSCTNNSTVGYQHIGYNVGGIVGRSCGYLYDCRNYAEVYGRKDVGGISGQTEPYIELNLTESTLGKLKRQIDELSAMIDTALIHAKSGVNTVTARLNTMADYADAAAVASENITTTGNITSTVYGNAEGSSGGSVTVDPSDVEIGSSIGTEGSVKVDANPPSFEAGNSGEIEGEIHGGLTEGSASAEHSASASGSVNASTQVVMNTSLHELSSAIQGLTGQMRLLNGEVNGVSAVLTDDLQAINNQINAISNTLFDVVYHEESDAGEDKVSDTSAETDIDSVFSGKILLCTNTAPAYGDINVGGITGSMAIEYELDPEDDISTEISAMERRQYELKAILQGCVNTGCVTAKRSYTGSICGKMDLGLILACEGYGDTKSESGDYVGGIAGSVGGTIRGCFVKCTLTGERYIGGIVGTGITEDLSGASSLVSGCYSLVDIPEYQQFIGAVSGETSGEYLENYFVSDTLAGINRVSLSGKAEPISYEELLAVENLPDQFREFSLTFTADGESVDSHAFDYNTSFEEDIYPDIPQKDGYYANWEAVSLQNLRFDTAVEAVYTPYLTALPSVETRADGRPIFFCEGQFDDENELVITAKANTPADFAPLFKTEPSQTLSEYLSDLFAGNFSGWQVKRDIVEQWQISVPDDGVSSHTLRFLAPDGETKGLSVYIRQYNEWKKLDTETVGSHLTFAVPAGNVEVAILSTASFWWLWLGFGLLILLIVWLIVTLIRCFTRKLPRREKRLLRQKTGRIILIILLVLILAAAAGVIAFFALGLNDGLDAYRILNEYNSRQEISMNLHITGEAGEEEWETELSLYRTEVDSTKVTCIEQDGLALYYADGMVFLENGAVYEISALLPDYT